MSTAVPTPGDELTEAEREALARVWRIAVQCARQYGWLGALARNPYRADALADGEAGTC